jgi:rhodanese-related sulfurtransferase
MSSLISEILATANERAKEKNLPYQGELLPMEAYTLLQKAPGARLIDVRTRAEFEYVGRIPGSVEIEWQTYPGGHANKTFLAELKAQIDKESLVMFICRSGVRSHSAAEAAVSAGFTQAYNVLEGFQGDKDPERHRDTIGGWRVAGLPWYQG